MGHARYNQYVKVNNELTSVQGIHQPRDARLTTMSPCDTLRRKEIRGSRDFGSGDAAKAKFPRTM